MANGIAMTPARRSELLRLLLEQQAATPQIRSGAELGLRMLAKKLRQGQIEELREQETAQRNTQAANTANIAGLLMGGGRQSVFGPVMDEAGRPAAQQPQDLSNAVAQTLRGDPQNPLALAALEYTLNKEPAPDFSARKAALKRAIGESDLPKETKTGLLGGLNAALDDDSIDRIESSFLGQFKPVERQEITNIVPLDERRLNTAAVESANASRQLRVNMGSTVPDIEANKGAVGGRGRVGQVVGGLTAFVLGDRVGDVATKMITGNDREANAIVQSRMSTVRAQLIPIVSGDTSGRYTEQEREIANKTLGVVEEIKTPVDFAKSWPEVLGGLKELSLAALENEYTQAALSDAVQEPYDLNTDAGFDALMDELEYMGYETEEAVRAYERLKRVQNAY